MRGRKEFINDIFFFLIQQEIYVRTTHSMKLLNVDFTRFGVTCGQVGACPS